MILRDRDIMFDLETLATTPDAVIITIGAVRFDPFGDDTNTRAIQMPHFYTRIDVGSCDWPEAYIDDNTLAWWAKQSPEAQHEAFGEGVERMNIRDALSLFFDFCRPCDRVWANGCNFDHTIIETTARRLGITVPWQFWQARDCRTVFRMVQDRDDSKNNHNALDDCVAQVRKLQQCIRKLGVQKLD